MSGDWSTALVPVIVAAALLIVPGLAVRLAGWDARTLTPYLFVPALSVGILAVAAAGTPIVRLPWSLLPVAILTIVAAAVAFGVRRWVGRDASPHGTPLRTLALAGGLAAAAVALGLQLAWAFGGPDNISQTFDNIIHLNSVRLALELQNASPAVIGSASDIGFYPQGWHSLVTLVVMTTGVDVPVGVNAANIAIGAIAWPASITALSAVLFRERAAALVASAALSTGFGAFPLLLFYFGVLYPNLTAYALLPAGLAAVLLLLRSVGHRPAVLVRSGLLLLVVIGAIALAHPNALLALVAGSALIVIYGLARRIARDRSRRSVLINAGLMVAVVVPWAGLWLYSRTPYEMSRWGPWQSAAQAFGEALLLSPRGYPVTLATAVLLVIGFVAVARTPRRLPVLLPFVAAAFLFIMVSGTGQNLLREMATRPWYNDPYRLAALLPVVGIPVAVLGALAVVDAVRGALARIRAPRAIAPIAAAVASVALFGVAIGPNVTAVAADTRNVYSYSDTSSLLTSDERALLDRLDELTPDDALIIANPWTGGSLAFALAGREVVERHVFGTRSDDQVYVDENLDAIADDPLVCEAIDRLGADYVLDFGSQNVFNREDAGRDREGLNDLEPSRHLVLVDSEGPDARLFRIEGC